MTSQPEPTPPPSDQVSGTAGDATHAPNVGPVSGNRTPMVVTLVLLGVIVLLVAGLTVASLVAS